MENKILENKIKEFFLKEIGEGLRRLDIMSILAIEQQAGVPKNVLYSFLTGKKYCYLGKHSQIIFNFLKNFGI